MTALSDAALSAAVVPLFYIGWLDFNGDPVRATTYPGGLTFGPTQTGDADLDGQTFIHVPGSIIEITPVTHQQGGGDAVTITLSGLVGPDDDLLDTLDVRASWQGRIVRLWHGTHDGAGGSIAISAYYTGYMMQASLSGDPESGQRVSVTAENYLAVLSQPRGRTYQDQAIFNAADKTASRIRAAANGVKGTALSGGGGGGREALADLVIY